MELKIVLAVGNTIYLITIEYQRFDQEYDIRLN
jgi:hypothetical protein